MKVISIAIACAIPAILALGALYWLFFVEDTHAFSRQLGREARDAFAVHAVPVPTSTIKIVGRSSPDLKVESADQDGSRIVAYVRNTGHTCIPYVELHYKMLAPDGTVIAANNIYQDDETAGLEAGQRVEIKMEFVPEDNRAVEMQVWATGESQLPCEQ